MELRCSVTGCGGGRRRASRGGAQGSARIVAVAARQEGKEAWEETGQAEGVGGDQIAETGHQEGGEVRAA
jgi:hypothetical protein